MLRQPAVDSARTAGRMMGTLIGLLRRWLSQDVARTNAAQASVRLQHRRHQMQDIEAFLAAQHHHPPRQLDAAPPIDAVHDTHPRRRS